MSMVVRMMRDATAERTGCLRLNHWMGELTSGGKGQDLTPSSPLWRTSIMLTEPESVFRSLKTDLGLRPVFHRIDVVPYTPKFRSKLLISLRLVGAVDKLGLTERY